MRLNFSLNKIIGVGTFILIVIYIIIYFLSCQLVDDSFYIAGSSDFSLLSRCRSILALIIIVSASIYYIIFAKRTSKLCYLLLIFNLYLFIHNCFYAFGGVINAVNLYTSMSLWIFIYVFFYSFSQYFKTLDSSKLLALLSVLFFLLFLVNYFAGTIIDDTYAFIESYFLITTLPLAYLLNNRKVSNFILLLAVIASVLSGKRTGAVVCFFVVILFILSNHKGIRSKIRSVLKLSFLIVVGCLLLSIVFESRFELLIDRMLTISDDGGSGRDQVFALVINDFSKSHFGQMLFGHGYNSVINSPSSLGYSAHNEFLEVLYDYGAFGLFLYLLIFVIIYNTSRSAYSPKVKTAYVISLLIFFLNSMFSHQILYTTNIIMLCAFWGYADARLVRS